jgi:hypothetical protein
MLGIKNKKYITDIKVVETSPPVPLQKRLCEKGFYEILRNYFFCAFFSFHTASKGRG